MSMQVSLSLQLDLTLFQIEEVEKAEKQAQQRSASLYTWKTSGRQNWLERGLSITDAIGIVILPHGLPDVIDMGNDPEDS